MRRNPHVYIGKLKKHKMLQIRDADAGAIYFLWSSLYFWHFTLFVLASTKTFSKLSSGIYHWHELSVISLETMEFSNRFRLQLLFLFAVQPHCKLSQNSPVFVRTFQHAQKHWSAPRHYSVNTYNRGLYLENTKF